MKPDRKLLLKIYSEMRKSFGHRHWWPGDTPFEIIVGAILTQNTSWKNVEKAILNLKKERVLSAKGLYALTTARLAALIRPAGYYNVKAKRLRNFLDFLFGKYGGSLKRMFAREGPALREELLGVNGIGPETADSILLYAGGKPFFVVDAYTKRIFSRHRLVGSESPYHEVQEVFMSELPARVPLFNDYHAQIVKTGNTFCRRTHPRCVECPLDFLFRSVK